VQHVFPPTQKTLRRYGLNLADWEKLASTQGHVCAICGKLPKSGRLHIDHQHVKGWAKLPPDQRKRFVRGLICFRCNNYAVAGNDLASAEAVVRYIVAHCARQLLAP
jgi:hypothetical protein